MEEKSVDQPSYRTTPVAASITSQIIGNGNGKLVLRQHNQLLLKIKDRK